MQTIEFLKSPSSIQFKLEDFYCKRHKQPLGAVCGSEYCENRLLCNDCMQEHDFTHHHEILFGYTFSKSYIVDKVNQFLKERIPVFQNHEQTKERMKETFQTAFDSFRGELLNQLDEFEYCVTEMIEESTKYSENYVSLKDHIDEMMQILDSSSRDRELGSNHARHYLSRYKSLLKVIEEMKKNFNYEQLQVTITNQSNEFLQEIKQRFNEFRTAWTNSFGSTKPHDLGSFLKCKPKLLQGFNDKVTAISYSENDRLLAALEGCYKIHFFNDVFNFERHSFRLGFSKFEDHLSLIKWTDNGSLILCNNNHKWVKLHYPSKTYSGEISTAPDGPIKKLGFFQELKYIIVATEYWVICYQASQTFMPMHYKIYCNGRLTDLCLIKGEYLSLVAVSTGTGYIVVHDIVNRTEKYQFRAHNSAVMAISFWKEQNLLISTGLQGDIKLWKMTNDGFKCTRRIFYDYGSSLTNLILIPSNGLLISVYNETSFVVYSVLANKKIGVKKLEQPIISPCYIKDAGKIVFGLDKALYQIKV